MRSAAPGPAVAPLKLADEVGETLRDDQIEATLDLEVGSVLMPGRGRTREA